MSINNIGKKHTYEVIKKGLSNKAIIRINNKSHTYETKLKILFRFQNVCFKVFDKYNNIINTFLTI